MTIIIDKETVQGGSWWWDTVNARATKSASQNVGINVWVSITWDWESYDTSLLHDNATNNSRFTIPDGLWWVYNIVGNIIHDSWYGGVECRLVVNWSTQIAYHQNQMQNKWVSLVADYLFTEWDYVELQIKPTQSSLNVLTTSNFSIHKIG